MIETGRHIYASEQNSVRSYGQGIKIDFGEKNTLQRQYTILNELPLAARQCNN